MLENTNQKLAMDLGPPINTGPILATTDLTSMDRRRVRAAMTPVPTHTDLKLARAATDPTLLITASLTQAIIGLVLVNMALVLLPASMAPIQLRVTMGLALESMAPILMLAIMKLALGSMALVMVRVIMAQGPVILALRQARAAIVVLDLALAVIVQAQTLMVPLAVHQEAAATTRLDPASAGTVLMVMARVNWALVLLSRIADTLQAAVHSVANGKQRSMIGVYLRL